MIQKNKKILIYLVLILYNSIAFSGGSFHKDNGSACINNKAIVGAWNFNAGRLLPKSFKQYDEFLPFVQGWDFRVNLPHTHFQLADSNDGSPIRMVGLNESIVGELANECATEGSLKSTQPAGTMGTYGHQNNSIWLFKVRKSSNKIFYKALPSRRDLQSSETENITSLTLGWRSLGPRREFIAASSLSRKHSSKKHEAKQKQNKISLTPAVSNNSIPTIQQPKFLVEKPAVAVSGRGIGAANFYIVARGKDNTLWFNSTLVNSTNLKWRSAWKSLGIKSSTAVSLVTVKDGKVALAWLQRKNSSVMVRIFDPVNNEWSIDHRVGLAEKFKPKLLWDGVALNVFYTKNIRLHHNLAFNLESPVFNNEEVVSDLILPVLGQYNATLFNDRIHVVIRRKGSVAERSHAAWHTTTTTAYGHRSKWSNPTFVGFKTRTRPTVVSFYENLYVIGVNSRGHAVYSKLNSNIPIGSSVVEKWSIKNKRLDNKINGLFSGLDVLSFNTDIYLSSNKTFNSKSQKGSYIVNFSRASMKQLLKDKWGVKLVHGSPGGGDVKGVDEFAKIDDIPAIGDFNGDGKDDLIMFKQRAISGVDGPAPVYVSLLQGRDYQDNEVWHKFFSLKGEIPMVGDFNGDGKDDIISFTQKQQKFSDGSIIGPAPVWVSLSDGSEFESSRIWHKFFSLKGEIPLVGDFNGDGKDDIATFTQKEQKDASGNVIGAAVVWVALSNGQSFEPSKIWHTFFSLKGEIPAIGDFNGDGKDDIVTFTQKRQLFANGEVAGNAPVWVALSNGSKFGNSKIWHTFFSLKGEIPQIGDMNMDGKDDIVTFVNSIPTNDTVRNSYVAYSLGNRFSRSSLWHSDFGSDNQMILDNTGIVRSPVIGNFSGHDLNEITGKLNDKKSRFPDIFAFKSDGAVHIAEIFGNTPYPAGAPWENYKWFVEKGNGMAQFPEWLFNGPNHCLGLEHRFALLGASGSGGGTITRSSIRAGGREGHVLQEFGHSFFENCFRADKNPFNLFNSIFFKPRDQGGLSAVTRSGCDDKFYDCRKEGDSEHYMLGLMVKYRVDGNNFRNKIINELNAQKKERLQLEYNWFKTNWYNGAEFKSSPSINASMAYDGALCLPGECKTVREFKLSQ